MSISKMELSNTLAYDQLSWFGQKVGRALGQAAEGIATVGASVKYFFEFGVHDIDPETFQTFELCKEFAKKRERLQALLDANQSLVLQRSPRPALPTIRE